MVALRSSMDHHSFAVDHDLPREGRAVPAARARERDDGVEGRRRLGVLRTARRARQRDLHGLDVER
eukprot:4752252-Alexandrium_andersonii.AAC.1